jgi:putative flippase GtrA
MDAPLGSISEDLDDRLCQTQNSLIIVMLKLFSRYVSVGVINTAIHWLCFAFLLHFFGVSQSVANLIAFCVAVTFSFFANARWTFNSQATSARYIVFVVFMGAMAAGTGFMADRLHISPLITLVSFSTISLVLGFFYSKFIVFRDTK